MEWRPLGCQEAWVAGYRGHYLRWNRRRKNGEANECWTLVETVRTAQGPRQRIVATLGKLPGLDEDKRAGWEEVARLLGGGPAVHFDVNFLDVGFR